MTTDSIEIRQIGDPVLHTPVACADVTGHSLLAAYSSILQQAQRVTGGIGIACNQCAAIAAPVALVQISTDDEATRRAAAQRYPGETLPEAEWMVNPEILALGNETYFPAHGEGCLSVAGPIRGKVKRHRTVRVRYQSLDGEVCEAVFSGLAAHIIQHEVDHLHGTVYLQRIFADCNDAQRAEIGCMLAAEAGQRPRPVVDGTPDDPAEPLLVFDRDGDAVVFDAERFAQALPVLSDATLHGMVKALTGL